MKILYDHQVFSMQQFGGISRYFANLHQQLTVQGTIKSKISALYSENEYVKDYPFALNNDLGQSIFQGHHNRTYRWNRRFCSMQIRQNSFDVFHPTYYDPYFLKYLRKPFVITVHDMIHEKLPHLFADAKEVISNKRLLIERADRIIAISNHTKQEIIRYYPATENKISVVRHGISLNETNTYIETNNGLPKHFILYVGERRHYKNFLLFAESMAKVLREDQQITLLCAGGGSFSKDEEDLFNKFNIATQCVQKNVSDAELKQLYAAAFLMVFPSLEEGFGLPIIEAFANGCTVACSSIPVFHEIAGKAAEFFDPASSASLVSAVKKLLYDKEYRNRLVLSSKKQVNLFTLVNSVAATQEVYYSLL